MTDSHEDLMDKFVRRFSAIERQILSPRPLSFNSLRPVRPGSMTRALAPGSLIVVVLGALIVFGAFVTVGARPSPRASLPAVASSHGPAPSPAPTPSQAPTTSQSPAAQSPSTEPARWRIAVVNGNRPVIVTLITDNSSSSWLVQPGERSLLLDAPAARPGEVHILSPSDSSTPCALLGSATFDQGSFTITVGPSSGGVVAVEVTPGTPVGGTARTDYYAGCSG
jgi:hypothetical protein